MDSFEPRPTGMDITGYGHDCNAKDSGPGDDTTTVEPLSEPATINRAECPAEGAVVFRVDLAQGL